MLLTFIFFLERVECEKKWRGFWVIELVKNYVNFCISLEIIRNSLEIFLFRKGKTKSNNENNKFEGGAETPCSQPPLSNYAVSAFYYNRKWRKKLAVSLSRNSKRFSTDWL